MAASILPALKSVWACATLGVPLRGDLTLGTVIGEEDGGLGTYALLQRGWRADACVIPEPTSLDLAPAASEAFPESFGPLTRVWSQPPLLAQ